MAPEVQTKYNWKVARREVVRTLIKILTTTRAVIEFERRPGGGNLFILLTLSFSLISTFKTYASLSFKQPFYRCVVLQWQFYVWYALRQYNDMIVDSQGNVKL